MADRETKFRILQVHNHYQIPGGEDTVVENEKKLLEEDGHTVIQYTRDNSELKTMGLFRKLLLPLTTIYNPQTAKDITQLIRRHKIDVVHVHNTLNLISPSVYYAALKCGVPVVQTVHNFRMICPGAMLYRDGHVCEDCLSKGIGCAVKYGCYRGSKVQTLICVINAYFHRFTGIYGKLNYICLTEFNKSKLLTIKQIKDRKVWIKPNFVTDKAEIIPYDQRPDQYVYAGRLEEIKGTDLLLKEWKRLGDKAPKLILCGTGPLEAWCKTFVQENDLKSVELRGYVENKETKQIIANSKALILPTQLYEGFPMTIAEAYNFGTPVIGSDIGNTGSLIENGVTGWKVDFTNEGEFCNVLEKVAHSLVDSTKFKSISAKYAKEENLKILLGVYKAVLGL